MKDQATEWVLRADDAPAVRTPTARSRWWREAVLILLLYIVYDGIRGSVGGNARRARQDGHSVLRWETWAHLDPEHALNSWMQHVTVVAVVACYVYATLHFVVTSGLLIFLYVSRRAVYLKARTVLVGVTAGALIGFWWFPVAPPRLLTGAGFHDTLEVFARWGWWANGAGSHGAASSIVNDFAAMPSLHLAWAAWCAATVLRIARSPWVRAAALLYPILTALVVLGTANHYLLDVIAGAALWFLCDRVAQYLDAIGMFGPGT